MKNPDGIFGIYQYLFDRILQPNQVIEHVNGGKLGYIEYNNEIYRLVNILGKPYDPNQHRDQTYLYVLLNTVESKTAIVVSEALGLIQTIPDPMPSLLENDKRFTGVIFTESRELSLIVSPSQFDNNTGQEAPTELENTNISSA